MDNKKVLIDNYIKQLNEAEKKALEIAKRNLESSFDIEMSIGFNDWLKNQACM
tara:strand:- start:695 stop:853 length:159 start_codon:yes stop_codon:yes gene_type:complete